MKMKMEKVIKVGVPVVLAIAVLLFGIMQPRLATTGDAKPVLSSPEHGAIKHDMKPATALGEKPLLSPPLDEKSLLLPPKDAVMDSKVFGAMNQEAVQQMEQNMFDAVDQFISSPIPLEIRTDDFVRMLMLFGFMAIEGITVYPPEPSNAGKSYPGGVFPTIRKGMVSNYESKYKGNYNLNEEERKSLLSWFDYFIAVTDENSFYLKGNHYNTGDWCKDLRNLISATKGSLLALWVESGTTLVLSGGGTKTVKKYIPAFPYSAAIFLSHLSALEDIAIQKARGVLILYALGY